MLEKVLLPIASILLVLAGLEAVLRLAGYAPITRLVPEGRDLILRASEDPRTIYELTPGAGGQAWGTRVRVNRHGLRGPELLEPSRERPRVVVLGDSIAFGSLVEEEAVVSSQLARRLRERGHPAEVLNLGVGGYDTLQEAARLEVFGLPLDPEVVVLVYCLNDVAIASANLRYIETLEEQRVGPLAELALDRFVRSRIQHLLQVVWWRRVNEEEHFRRAYAGQIADLRGDPELRTAMQSAGEELPSRWYRDADRVGRLRFAFRRLAETAAGDLPVIVAIVPWLEAAAGGYAHRVAHEIVAREARRVGFEPVDLLEAFQAEGLDALRASPGDPIHPDARGHALIAEGVVDAVIAQLDPRGAAVRRAQPFARLFR